MKKTFLPLALLAVLPLASCASLTDNASKGKAGLNDGEVEVSEEVTSEETSVSEETTSEETVTKENEYVALFNKLVADDYLSIKSETVEETYPLKTTITYNDLSLTLSYKEVVKEEKEDEDSSTDVEEDTSTETEEDTTSEDESLSSEGKHHFRKHGHGEGHGKRDDKTRYEGELVFGENTYSVEGKSKTEDGCTEFDFKFKVDETNFAELEFVTGEDYKEFYYEEGSREELSKAYAYSLFTSDEFSYVYALALEGESFNEVILSKFVYEEVTYLSVDTYLDETETHILGTLTVTDTGTTFEEVTFTEPDFDDDDIDDEDDCDCDCDCCQNHHHGNGGPNEDKEDFDHDEFDFDFDFDEDDFDFDFDFDENDFEDFDFEGEDFEDFDFQNSNENGFSGHQGGSENSRPNHR